jgi:hypothetical protein
METSPDYDVLVGYFVALGAALLVIVIATAVARCSPWKLLPDLDKDWSWDDSFATNAGLAAALFTGIFGSTDVINAVLGEDEGKNLAAVATVEAAITAAIIGLGPVILTVVGTFTTKNQTTVAAVDLAAMAVITANGGFIIAMSNVIADSPLGKNLPSATVIAVIAMVVLCIYSGCALYRTLTFEKTTDDATGLWNYALPKQARAAML